MLKFRYVSLFILALATAVPALGAPPDVALTDFAGKDRKVRDFIGKGQWTVVVFWAHDCVICKQEIHQMVFFHDAHRKKDAHVLGISVDGYANRKKAQQFIDDHGLNFTNLITDPAAVARFGGGKLIGTPTFYIYRPDGRLAARNIGPVTQEEIEAFIKTGGRKK